MNIDRIDKIEAYYDALPGLESAMAFIRKNPYLEPGRYDCDGGYVMYQEGVTKPIEEGTFEAHTEYIDVQILQEGAYWYSLWNRTDNMAEVVPYNPERDSVRLAGEGSLVELRQQMFVVFYPYDAHKPDRHLDAQQPAPYKKYVIKLKVQ